MSGKNKKDMFNKVAEKAWKNKWTLGGTAAAWMVGIPILPFPGMLESIALIGGGLYADNKKKGSDEPKNKNPYDDGFGVSKDYKKGR